MVMEPDNGNFSTCLRHPSQILTGICSFCLAERLASVDSEGRSQSEIVEISPESSNSRVRKTLLSLFELDDRTNPESGFSSSIKLDYLDDKCLKERNGSFWLRWRMRRPKKRVEIGVGESETKLKVIRSSCDSTSYNDPGRPSWDVPRHSWDGGSMVSKAFACSFACLEEPQDDPHRVRRALPLPPVENEPSSGRESQLEASVPGISRKKSHRWNRVWDWSITSPFRDLVKKREHGLERSLSESWREGRKVKGMEIMVEPEGHASARSNKSLNRSINATNGDLHNSRIDLQKKKESRFGRSRSVHYSSPGNFDNGLLRFYLTPLRSSRRSAAKGRTRTSHSFARGILGIH